MQDLSYLQSCQGTPGAPLMIDICHSRDIVGLDSDRIPFEIVCQVEQAQLDCSEFQNTDRELGLLQLSDPLNIQGAQ